MNVNDGALNYELILNDARFQAALKRNAQLVQSESNQMARSTSSVESSFGRLAVAAAGFFSVQAAERFISSMVKVRGEFQQLSIAMTTMLGSKQKADELMNQLVTTAATTPFGLTEISQSAKQLLAYGTAADQINDTLTRLGNIASGLSIPLSDLVYLYGTTQVQGRLFTQDVRQFMGRGIPLVQELAKQMGKTTDQINAMVTAGQIGFPEVQQVIKGLTDQGGMFFDLMKKQSASLTGQISNLGDAFDSMLNEIGTGAEGVIGSAISGIASLVENYKTVLAVLAEIAAVYGAYKAAIIAFNVVQIQANMLTELAAIKGAALTTVEKLKVFWIQAETVAQAALNKVMLANPYAAVAAAVAGIITAMVVLRDNTTAAEKATKQLNDEQDRRNRQIEDQKQKTQELINIIHSETSTKFAQMQAFKQLQGIYPGVLKNMDLLKFKNSDVAKSQKEFNAAIESNSLNDLQKDYENAIKEVERLKRISNELSKSGSGGGDAFAKNAEFLAQAVSYASQLKTKLEANKQTQFEANASDVEKLDYYNKQLSALRSQQSQLENNLSKTKQTGVALLDWKSTLESISLNRITDQITGLMNKIKGIGGNVSESNRSSIDNSKSLDELEEIRQKIVKAFGSATSDAQRIALKADKDYADQRIKSMDIIAASNATANKRVTDSDKQYVDKKREIMDQIAKLDQDNYRKSLSQNDAEVQAVKDKYSEILKAIDEYNRKAPAGHRIGAGTITALQQSEQRAVGNTVYEQQTEDFKTQIAKQKEVFQAYEDWKRQLGAASADQRYGEELEGFKSFQGYVKAQMAVLMAQTMVLGGMTPAMQKRYAEFKKILEQAESDAKRSNDEILKDALTSTETAQQKIAEIKRKYQQQADALTKAGLLTPDRQSVIDKNMTADIDAVINDVLSKENDLKSAGDAIAGVTKSQIRSQIESLRQYLQSAADLTQEQKEQLLAVIQSLSLKMLTATDNTTGVGQQNTPAGFSNLQDLETTIDNIKAQIASTMSQIGKLSTTVGAAANPRIKLLMEHVAVLKTQLDDLNRQRLGTLGEAFANLSEIIEKSVSDLGLMDTALGGILTAVAEIGKVGGTALKGISQAVKGITDIKGIDGKGGLGQIFKDAGGGLKGLSAAASAIAPVAAGIGTAISAIGGIISGFNAAYESALKAQKEMKARQQELFQGELDYNALLRQRALMVDTLNQETLKSMRLKERELELQLNINGALDEAKRLGQAIATQTSVQDDFIKGINNILKNGEQITGTHIESSGALWWKRSKTVQDIANLQGLVTSDQFSRLLSSIIGSNPFNRRAGETLVGNVADYEAALEVMKQLDELATNHKLTDETQKMYEDLQKQYGTIQDLENQLASLKEHMTETFSGTTAASIADSIIEGFKQGKRSIADFADDFNRIISQSILSTIKDSLLSGAVKKVWDDFQKFVQANSEANGNTKPLTAEQIAQLRKDYNQGITDTQTAIDSLQKALGIDLLGVNTPAGLSGQIKSITQDQASELGGLARLGVDVSKRQLTALQDANAMFNKHLSELVGIRVNTANTVDRLDSAIVELKAIRQNTKSVDLRGVGGI